MRSHPQPVQDRTCPHSEPVCINPYELIRKYRCGHCRAVMMCACDEAFGRRFLSHQLQQGAELKTQRRVPVTLGFRPNVCAECRGLPAEPAPKAEAPGCTSKIKRYYWRELFFETWRRRADWDEAHQDASAEERREAHAAIETQVLDEIKELHASTPKYAWLETSAAEVLKRCAVDVLPIEAEYVEEPRKGAVIRHGDEAISPEAFVTKRFESEGWSVMPLESIPFHALFGVMMWLLIQDSSDPLVRMVGFGDRAAFGTGSRPKVIQTFLPEDFGCQGYAERRRPAVERHFRLLCDQEADLLWLFDYWREHSADFRQYLWAHQEADVERARRLVEILTPAQILTIQRYLVDDYWGHYVGWPDLLLHRNEEVLFVEVKSSGDQLSQAQKRWIADNHDRLHLPFQLVKLHRPPRKPTPRPG